jgi:hypothetical protein
MAKNFEPFEVIASAPIALYIADADTAAVALDDDIDEEVDWAKVGLSGDLNYDSGSGVKVEHPQSINKWRSMGDLGTRKVFRTEEDCIVRAKIMDLRLETYALAINGNDITTVAAGVGTVGYKRLGLSRGHTVNTKALIVRLLVSPYGEEWIGQYYFPRVAIVGSPTVEYMKGDPAGLDFEFHALVKSDVENEQHRFGWLDFQHADANT